jgi:Fe-S cluster biogenesis protein NfuA
VSTCAVSPAPTGQPSGTPIGVERLVRPETGTHTSATQRLEELVRQVEDLADPLSRNLAQECLHAVLELYGEGLTRVLQLVENAGTAGGPVRQALLQDQLVRSLLLIHGLHPESLETRLHAALEKVRPYLKSHGGNIELVSLRDSAARLRFEGTCQSCPSSSVTMELAIRRAIEEACPDLLGLELDDARAGGNPA